MTKLIGYFLSGNTSCRESLNKNYKYLDEVIPTWLEIEESGKLIENHSQDEMDLLSSLFSENNVIPMLQNRGLKSSIGNLLVEDSQIWEDVINLIVSYLQKTGYEEINIDLEGIKRENRNKYNNFIERLAFYLHREGYRVSLSLPAKTADNNNSTWSGAYDYEQLGKFADKIMIMAYDFHWPGGPSGAIAPIFWVQDVIDYVILKISPAKIYLGIPFYGYDWVINSGAKARGLSHSQVLGIKNRYDIIMEWDQESQSPYLKYEDKNGKHEVWFENKNSIQKKIDLIEEFQLAGAVFWRLGLEDPKIWEKLDIK